MDTFSSPSCYFLRFLFKAEIICKTRSNESQKNVALGLNERFIFTASTMWKTRRTKISYGPLKIKSFSVQFSSCFTHQNCCCVPSIKKNCRCSLSLALDHLSWPLFLQLLLAVELLLLLRFSSPSPGEYLMFWRLDRYLPIQITMRTFIHGGGLGCRDLLVDTLHLINFSVRAQLSPVTIVYLSARNELTISNNQRRTRWEM